MPDYPKITQRQAKVLAAIVKENCDTGAPVASRDLIDKGYFDVSAATLRNEMQTLETNGFIMQPHTSAGRVPTDMGFRYFVSELMERVKLSIKEQERLRQEVRKLQAVNVEVGRRLAKLLADTSNQASFALLPGETSTVGLSKILNNPHLPPEDAREIAEFFDNIDEYADKMLAEYSDKPTKAVRDTIAACVIHILSPAAFNKIPDFTLNVVNQAPPISIHHSRHAGLLSLLHPFLSPPSPVALIGETVPGKPRGNRTGKPYRVPKGHVALLYA